MPALPNTSRAVFLNESFEAREEDENAKPLCRPVDKSQVQVRNRQIRQWYTQEQQWYATERKKVPYEIPVENVKIEKRKKRRHQSEEAEEPTIPSEDENHSIQGSDSEWAEPGNRPAQPANQRRPYRHVPSPTYYSSRRRKKKRRRNESSAAESTSALDESSERGELPEESDLDSDKDSESESDSDQSENSDSNEESGKKSKLFQKFKKFSETVESESPEKPGPSRLRSQSKHQSPKTPKKSPRFTPRKRSTRKILETDSESEVTFRKIFQFS